MEIEAAMRLQPGDTVHCPEDRGVPAGWGTVIGSPTYGEVHTSHEGQKYLWVTVHRKSLNSKAVWPTNRLS